MPAFLFNFEFGRLVVWKWNVLEIKTKPIFYTDR